MDHAKPKAEDEKTQGEFHFDFCFPGDEDNKSNLTILGVKERLTKMIMASVVPSKSTGEFISKRIAAFIKEVGYEGLDITVKSDQEKAIKAILDDVSRVRNDRGGGRTGELR